jgi:hypothetical protein
MRSDPRRQKPAPGPVRVRVFGTIALVEGLPRSAIPSYLLTTATISQPGGKRGVRLREETRRHARFVPAGLLIPAGLAPRVAAEVERTGRAVELRDETKNRPGLAVDEQALARLGPREAAFIGMLRAQHRGLISAPRLEDRVALVAAAALALPHACISIGVASRSLAVSFHSRLSRRLREPVALHHKHGVVFSEERLRVATAGSLDPWWSDLVLFVEASDAITRLFQPTMSELKNGQAAYGFVDESKRLGACERLRLEGFLGPIIHRVGPGPATVSVLVVKLEPVPSLGVHDALERKRRAIWGNQVRNKVIARTATQLANESKRLAAKRVAVLVESPEHGRALARLLNGWPLLDRRPERRDGPRDDGELPARSIVTYVRARQLGILDVDVLVRADGGGWPLPSIGFPLLADAISADVTLVDFDDNGDARLTSDTQSRLADYRGRGWKVAPFPVYAAAENDFGATRARQDDATGRELILRRSELVVQPG